MAEYELVWDLNDDTIACLEAGCNEPRVYDERWDDSFCSSHTDEAHQQEAADMAVKRTKESA